MGIWNDVGDLFIHPAHGVFKGDFMNTDTLFFFRGHTDALPLYESFEKRVLDEISDVRIVVQSSQISFYNRHLFACVSFAKVRKKKDCPASYIVITIGLDHKIVSPRIEIATEPYPNRWTHHILISEVEDIDDELMMWVQEAAVFSNGKR